MDASKSIISWPNCCDVRHSQLRRAHCAASVTTFRAPCTSSQSLTLIEVSK